MSSLSEAIAPEVKRMRSNSSEFSLPAIREALVRQEDTIIFAMIERGQFAKNRKVYQRGSESLAPEDERCEGDSFFEHFLYQTEKLHSTLGRYRAQYLEHAFFKNRQLPQAHLSHSPVEPWGKPLKQNAIR